MKKRIINNWQISLIGLILILSSIVSVFLDKATWLDVTPILGLALLLFGLKDPINTNKNKGSQNPIE